MWPEPLSSNTWEVGMRYCPPAGGGMIGQLPAANLLYSALLYCLSGTKHSSWLSTEQKLILIVAK